jgi:hypothetical protein
VKATLDCAPESRSSPGRPDRAKGCGNYQWTPTRDEVLKDLCARLGPSVAKNIMQKRAHQDARVANQDKRQPRPVLRTQHSEFSISDTPLATTATGVVNRSILPRR